MGEHPLPGSSDPTRFPRSREEEPPEPEPPAPLSSRPCILSSPLPPLTLNSFLRALPSSYDS